MAGVFGVAAGAIGKAGFAIQLAESIHKMKSFCERVKDAPAELEEYVEELEASSKLLDSVSSQGSQPRSVDKTLLEESVALCRKAVNRIAVVVDEL